MLRLARAIQKPAAASDLNPYAHNPYVHKTRCQKAASLYARKLLDFAVSVIADFKKHNVYIST